MFSWSKSTIYKLETPGESLEIIGSSRAAKRTGFYVRNRGFFLDCGIDSDFSPQFTFITHLHHDHCREAICTLLNCDDHNKLATFFVPAVSANSFNEMINCCWKTTKGGNAKNPGCRVIGATIGPSNFTSLFDVTGESDIIEGAQIILGLNCLKNKINKKIKKPWLIEYIRCNHSCPTTGYGFSERRTKIKDIYMKKSSSNNLECILTQEDFEKHKQDGTLDSLKDIIDIPLFCYLGDTDHKVFESSGNNEGYKIEKYPVIIVECTFFKPEDKSKAKKDKHMHWDNLIPWIKAFPDKYFKLYHFSNKYTEQDLDQFQLIINKTFGNSTIQNSCEKSGPQVVLLR